MPAAGQWRFEGKTVYKYGKTPIYMDQGVVYAQIGGKWLPVALPKLDELA